MGRAREHIGIDLRPAQAEHPANDAHQTVFDVVELRGLLCALAVHHDESMLVGCERAIVIVASENSIGEALAGIARATSHQGIGYRAVVVVDDADGRSGRRGLNVKGHGDRAIRIHNDVGAIHIFGELAAAGGSDGCRRNRGPLAEGSGDQGIGRGIGEI